MEGVTSSNLVASTNNINNLAAAHKLNLSLPWLTFMLRELYRPVNCGMSAERKHGADKTVR